MHAFSWKQFHVRQGGSFSNNTTVDCTLICTRNTLWKYVFELLEAGFAFPSSTEEWIILCMYVCVVYAFTCMWCTCVGMTVWTWGWLCVSSLVTLHIIYWARVSLSSKFIISASLASQFALGILSLSLACWNYRQPAIPSWLFKWVQWIWTLVLRLV